MHRVFTEPTIEISAHGVYLIIHIIQVADESTCRNWNRDTRQ